MNKTNIWIIDAVLIVGTLTALIFFMSYSGPMIIAPLNNPQTPGTEVLFSIDNAGSLLIENNINFTNPKRYIIKDGLKINLQSGEYYWKIKGVSKTEIKKVRVASEIHLELKKSGDHYDVVNVGTAKLNVDIYNGTKLLGKIRPDAKAPANLGGNKYPGVMG